MNALHFTLLAALFASLPVHAQEEGAPAEPEATDQDDPEPDAADEDAPAEPAQPEEPTDPAPPAAPAEPAKPEASAEPEARSRTVNPGQGRYLSPGMGEAVDKGDGIFGLSSNLSQVAFAPVNGLELWLGVSGFNLLGTGSTGGISWSHDLGDGITFNSSAIATRKAPRQSLITANSTRGIIRRTASLGFTFSSGAHHASVSSGYGTIAPAVEQELSAGGEFSAGVPVRLAAQVRVSKGFALVFDRQIFFAPSLQPGSFLQSRELDDSAFTFRLFPKRRPGRWDRTEAGDPVHYWDIGLISQSIARHFEFMGQRSEYSPLEGDTTLWISHTVNFAAAKDRRNARRKSRQQKASK